MNGRKRLSVGISHRRTVPAENGFSALEADRLAAHRGRCIPGGWKMFTAAYYRALKGGLKAVAAAAAALWLLLALGGPSPAEAQVRLGWSIPHQLSTAGRKGSEASLVADPAGYVHVFWTETLPDERSLLRYARFDGQTWSLPIDIRVSEPFTPIKTTAPAMGPDGVLHLAWVEGNNGPAYYSQAPAGLALRSQEWRRPTRIQMPADNVRLLVDASGSLHLLTTVASTSPLHPGVYYLRSADQGITWSPFVWLDPDIPAGFTPASAQFALDKQGGLHAVWFYISFLQGEGDWLRYTNSLDGGQGWSRPLTLAKESEGAADMNTFARPNLAVSGDSVHVVWAAGFLLYRNHRYSTDRGANWTAPARIFGELNGQAGDSLTVDGLGRVHFFGQIRFPMAIYHVIWDGTRWSPPGLIYFIRDATDSDQGSEGEASATSEEAIPEGIVAAHNTHAAVRLGYQLVLTFTDPPPAAERRLVVTQIGLDDLPAAAPAPAATAGPETEASPAAVTPVTPPSPAAGTA
ncbi:MAG: sialidase family protein, partial [Candidatus Promineifilaceae bacterium]